MKTTKFFIKLFSILIIVLIPSGISSQKLDEIVTDRPDQTESPYTVPIRCIQVELGAAVESFKGTYTTFYHPDPFTASSKYYTVPTVLLRYGITNNIELRLSSDYTWKYFTDDYTGTGISQHSSDFGPVIAGAKFNVVKEKNLVPETALLFSLEIPTQKYNDVNAELIAAFQNTLSRRFSISYNIGAFWDGASSKIENYLYSASLGISLTKKLSAFAEVFGTLQSRYQPDNRIDGGFTYLIAKNIQADIYGGTGITDYTPDYFIGAGLSFRLPR